MSIARRPGRPRPWWQKLAWMVAIWAASVAVLGVVAWLFRVVMKTIGMSL